jgi:isopenicillin N synthase-like dioxygenase
VSEMWLSMTSKANNALFVCVMPCGSNTSYSYKAIGISKVDSKGTPDRCEFWGLSKDAIFSHDTQAGTMPPLVTSNTTLLQDFATRSHSIGLYILTHLEKHFKFPESALTSVHRLSARSSDQIRLLKMPPQPTTDRGTSLLAHTDFGSITLLWNVVGGLQILPREAGTSDVDGTSDQWQYVQPQPGCVIVNMGDAIVTLTNGALSSNLHRVTTPPGAQADLVRYSAVYFMRPEDDVLMRPLGDGPADRALKEEGGENDERKYHTVKEWVALKTASFQKALAPMQSNGGIASYEG